MRGNSPADSDGKAVMRTNPSRPLVYCEIVITMQIRTNGAKVSKQTRAPTPSRLQLGSRSRKTSSASNSARDPMDRTCTSLHQNSAFALGKRKSRSLSPTRGASHVTETLEEALTVTRSGSRETTSPTAKRQGRWGAVGRALRTSRRTSRPTKDGTHARRSR